ncbi:MAG: hypothetical protein PHU42_03395 [Patescibacteria group bacterium]|nr:hypothetical protein [Patescibacteria group bacterium]
MAKKQGFTVVFNSGYGGVIKLNFLLPTQNKVGKWAKRIHEKWSDSMGRKVYARIFRAIMEDGGFLIWIMMEIKPPKPDEAIIIKEQFVIKKGPGDLFIIKKSPSRNFLTGRFIKNPHTVSIETA